MIFTERTITVVNDSATINKPLILYRGDKNIELKITIAESQFKFRNTDASNVIETTDASYAQLVINTPYNSPIFSDVAVTKNGAVIFVITEAMIDEIREVGAYEIQIRLLDDNKQSRASIPPVSNAIEIREPIAIEDGSAVDSNTVNVAKVNRALTTTSAPLEAFDSQGNYIKKTWGDGDPITDAALNKMEAGIDGVNKKIANANNINDTTASATTTYSSNKIETIKGNISSQIKEIAKQTRTNSNLTGKLMKMIQGEAIKIVGFGDSTMYGTGLSSNEKSIPTMLQEKLRYMYGDNVTVINSGLPGSGAKEMFAYIDERVISENPDIVIFWSGLNDAERFTIEEYNEYCGKIFEKLKDNNIEILVCSPICSMKNTDNFKHKVKYYAEAIKKKASQYNLYFIDMFEEFSRLFDTGELLNDAFTDEIHPKQLGYKYMCDIILKHICLNYRPNIDIGENIYVHSPFTYIDNIGWDIIQENTPGAPCKGLVLSKLEDSETDGKFKFMLYLDKKTELKIHCYTETTPCVTKLRDFGAEYKEINFVNSKGILYNDSITVEVDAGLHLFEFWRSDITQGKFGLFYIEVLQNYDNLEIPKLVREGLTLQNNWTNPGGYEKVEVFRYGDYISVQGIITSGLEESDQILFVLPENYRPEVITSCVGCCLSNDSTGFKSVIFEINTNGEVKLKNYYGNGWLSLNGISFYI